MLLVKEWVSSASLSQSPTLVLPRQYMSRLDGVDLDLLPRRSLGKRECDELLVSMILSLAGCV